MLWSTRCCYILKIHVYGFRKDLLSFSYNKSMEAIDPQDAAGFDPRGLIGSVYVGTTRHYYILI